MNDTNVNVQNSPYIKTNIINNITIKVTNVILFTSAVIYVNLYQNKIIVDNKVLQLVGQDYINWVDDSYIVNYVLTALNLKPADIEVSTN